MHSDGSYNMSEFRALPTIASQFPVVFDKTHRWTEFHSECNKCQKVLDGECLRGHITRPFGKAYLLDAWGSAMIA